MNLSTTPQEGSVRVAFKKGPSMLLKEGSETTLVIGVEKETGYSRRELRSRVKQAIRTAKQYKIKALTLDLGTLAMGDDRGDAIADVATNVLLAGYDFLRYKTDKHREEYAADVAFTGLSEGERSALKRGEIIGTVMNAVRDLSNTPGGDMTPQMLAEGVRALAEGASVTLTVLDKAAIEKEGMGALLGVARGSTEDPRFIVLEYWGAGKEAGKPVVFVGKGITFDTGGLNLKPSDAVLDMHLDMSGGAAVAGAVIAAARLGIKKNVVALIPSAENMVSGESFRPGDVLTSLSGKTIDVLNTDAEGRLVLADGLTYAKRYDPSLVVDVATLTGAALVALGQHASAIMSHDAALAAEIQVLGEKTGDYTWPLPLWNEYKQYTKGVFGDVANIPSSNGRYGGSINGGMFLSHFAEGYPWVHIDMAPRMTAAPGDHLAKGSTGEPMRLLLALAETR